ncbi:FR47-like protein [Vibrio sp. B1FLJ16]|uniref:GNAT family N-acetyltransferase n=1 Tax=Vibrio sp. B1FLJ16 TaxID=2751178 RepID=UPI0015F746D9|nr:GNAT family N-acetyltransferase [Vibrio sp. B1FLJ16]CAD7807098.1 FR47-like protein [Vibrio sp. B1FLJ16]CAE6903758.1 FR47-like protein [Vibrio sp. B1FLJ16]
MRFQVVKESDVELQKEFLLIALWTPDNEPNHKPDILDIPHIKEYYANWGKDGDLGFFAFSSEDKPVGLIQLRHKSSQTQKYADYPEIAIAVHPEYRGLGVASSLMQHLVENSVSGLRLGVHPQNTSAIKLYEKFGFRVYEVAQSGYPQMVREK